MAQRILLHICCGPCSIYPVKRLQDQGLEVIGLYYNPNIHPAQEYIRRREGAKEVAAKIGFKLICKDEEYDPGAYLRSVAFREDNRCHGHGWFRQGALLAGRFSCWLAGRY